MAKRKTAKTRKPASTRPKRSGRRVTEMASAPPQVTPEMTREEAHAVADRIIGQEPRGESWPDREAPRDDVDMWATREMGYGDLHLDRGQVFRMKVMRNDALLKDLHHVEPCERPGQRPRQRFACPECGAKFMEPGMVEGHGRIRHAPERRRMPPPTRQPDESQVSFEARLDRWAIASGDAADNEVMQRDKIADEVHPLHVEQTAASRA